MRSGKASWNKHDMIILGNKVWTFFAQNEFLRKEMEKVRGVFRCSTTAKSRKFERGKGIILTQAMVQSYPVKLLCTVPETSITNRSPFAHYANEIPDAIKSNYPPYNKCTNKHEDLNICSMVAEESIDRWKIEAINYSRISGSPLCDCWRKTIILLLLQSLLRTIRRNWDALSVSCIYFSSRFLIEQPTRSPYVLALAFSSCFFHARI